jgi:hypothetical protein
MKPDIFKFWAQIKRGEKIHPADKAAFQLMEPRRHGFQLQCLPSCFSGRLRDASVVLLFLSPGYVRADDAEALSKVGRDYYCRKWRGREPLRDDGGPGTRWARSRTRGFGDYEKVRKKIALLNIGAYHSKTMKSYASMLALPSSRMTLDWAQTVLFPQAMAGDRIVICMRAAAYWGLERGKKYPGMLFAPKTTRSGHLQRNRENRIMMQLARRRLGSSRARLK